MSTFSRNEWVDFTNNYYERDVACAVVHLRNGESFTYCNNTFYNFPMRQANVNEVMRAVADVNDKLMEGALQAVNQLI